MDNNTYKIDYQALSLMAILKYKNRPDLINKDKDKLHLLVIEYLKQNGANQELLDKPGVIERVKKILFENMLFSDNLKIASNGAIIDSQSSYMQVLSVLEDGNIIFFKEFMQNQELIRRVTTIDSYSDGIECKFSEFAPYSKYKIRKEYIVSLDENGFDKSIQNCLDAVERYREIFKPVISVVDDKAIYAIPDFGEYGIATEEEAYFLGKGLKRGINTYRLNPDIVGSIKQDSSEETIKSYPVNVKIKKREDISKIKENYERLKGKYPNVDQFFIDRFGKEFLIQNGIISRDCSVKPTPLIERIKLAKEEEIEEYFKDKTLSYPNLVEIISALYEEKYYYKSFIFLRKMNDDGLENFLDENSDLESGFLASVISFVRNDNLKLTLFSDNSSKFDLSQQISIIETLDDENTKVDFYNKRIMDILEYDQEEYTRFFEIDNEASPDEFPEYLSQTVLDSLKEHDNRFRFLSLLKPFVTIKYETIRDFSKDELDAVILDREGELTVEEYSAILQTCKLEDDEIIDFLESNWNEGLNLAEDCSTVDLKGEYEISFKELALSRIIDDDKRVAFLLDHEDDFSAGEITALLKELETNRMLELGREFGLTQGYYVELLTIAEDEFKFEYLDETQKISEDDFTKLIVSIEDKPKAFELVEERDEFSAIQKVRILSQMEIDEFDDQDQLNELKIRFLKEHKQEIIDEVTSRLDLDSVNDFIKSFALNGEKEVVVEEIKKAMSRKDEDLPR